MLPPIRFAVVLSAILLMLAPARAEACSCIAGAPICETFWKTDVVFSGTVIEIASTPNPRGERFLADKRVRFQVLQSWRGTATGMVDVMTGSGGGDCGYTFEKGASYLVYAHSRGGTLSTGICSRTRLLADAGEDLAYVKTVSQPSATGRVIGSVRYQRDGSSPPLPWRYIAGYLIELSDGRRTWKATSNSQGQFEFRGVPAGTFTVKLSTPETEHAFGPSKITLADPRGCAAADFYVVPDGRIGVRIVDQSGAPAADIRVELLEVDAVTSERPMFPRRTLKTDPDGRVEFSQLHPKPYALAINGTEPPSAGQPFAASYFPGVGSLNEARTIDLTPGERMDLGEWTLPRTLRERKVSGQVFWPDSKPAAGAHVLVGTSRRGSSPYRLVDRGGATTDTEGRFTLTLHEEIAYEVWAYVNVGDPIVQWNTSRVEVASDSSLSIRLELQPPPKR